MVFVISARPKDARSAFSSSVFSASIVMQFCRMVNVCVLHKRLAHKVFVSPSFTILSTLTAALSTILQQASVKNVSTQIILTYPMALAIVGLAKCARLDSVNILPIFLSKTAK